MAANIEGHFTSAHAHLYSPKENRIFHFVKPQALLG
jgi:hypothetical protein